MKLKNVVKKVVLTSTVMGLAVSSFSVNADAAKKVVLRKNDAWANSDKFVAKQMSQANGYVYADSEKPVAYVLEYRDADGQWRYEKRPENWIYWEADTHVPSDTGIIHGETDCRLQLNPKGAGNNGKGGHAVGYAMKLR
jgi:hypothetical protein